MSREVNKVLTRMNLRIKDAISNQVGVDRFGSAMTSSGFLNTNIVRDQTSTTGIPDFGKVSRIMDAATSQITYGGQERSLEMFNKFVCILYKDMKLYDLAEDCVKEMGT